MRKQSIIALALAVTTSSCEGSFFPTVATVGRGFDFNRGTVIIITPNTARIPVGTSLRLSTNVPFERQSEVEFISLSPTIASVDQFGLVTAFIPGTVIVRVRFLNDPFNFTTVVIEVVTVAVPVVTFP